MNHFNDLGGAYADFVKSDPMRNGLHYPAVLEKLDATKHGVRQRILDVGCGDGLFDRIMAIDPAREVTGFDPSRRFIEIALEEDRLQQFGIRYDRASAHEFETEDRFDDAVSVMVLPYAPDAAYLSQFFRAASKPLENDGSFVSVVFNPDFKAFGMCIGNRLFSRTDDGKVQVHFLNPASKEEVWKTTPTVLTQFTRAEYETGAKDGGFAKVTWEKLYPTEDAVEEFTPEFWEACVREQPYALLIATK
ncbi:class I SAM-dependent methyltransferase [Candidatus Uhrbacteria bacterium]|nr:class I SAM-dependent methyltransferase [Candidatus Uhrbacteria bacterium]